MSDIPRQMYRDATPFLASASQKPPVQASPAFWSWEATSCWNKLAKGQGELGKRKLNRREIDAIRREEHRRKESPTRQLVLSTNFDSPLRTTRREQSALKDFPSQNVILIELLGMHQQSVSGWKQKKAFPI